MFEINKDSSSGIIDSGRNPNNTPVRRQWQLVFIRKKGGIITSRVGWYFY